MPNFPVSTMSDAQARDIYAYIRTFKSNAPELKEFQPSTPSWLEQTNPTSREE